MMRKLIAILILTIAPQLASAANFIAPRYRAQDVNGTAIPSAKLYFYAAGTTTAKATYSDAILSTANANPVVADANGWFGEIWMLIDNYKVVLKDAAGATVWTVDNYNPTRTAASSATSAAAFTATNSSTGTAISATGGGASAGVTGYGGTTSGAGGSFQGGAPNGKGVIGISSGSGNALHGDSSGGTGNACYCSADTSTPVSSALQLNPQDTAPSTPAEGDIYANSTTNDLQYYDGTSYVEISHDLTGADVGSTCTLGQIRADTGGGTDEVCFCVATNTWWCIAVSDSTGPAD